MKLAALILCASLSGCAWWSHLRENPVDAVMIAERNADLAIAVLVDEWQRTVKPTLPQDEAAAFQARLDAAIDRVRVAQAAALDAARVAAAGRAENWSELAGSVISAVADVVALVDRFRASHRLPVSEAQRFARARIEAAR